MSAWDADGDFDRLEGQIYEAALVPDLWPDVLDRLGAATGGLGAVLWSRRHTTSAWIASSGVYDVMQRFVEEGWADRNPRYDTAISKGFDREPRFITEADLFDTSCFLGMPLFAELLLPAGLGWSAGTAVVLPDDLLVLSVERSWEAGPVPLGAQNLLDRLRPHLARSAMIAARLAFERTRTAVETLAQLGFPAAAVSKEGKVLLANDLFIAGEGWTIAAGDRIVIGEAGADALVGDALMRLGTSAGVRSIPIRAPGEKVAAVVHLVPVRGAAQDLFSRAGALLVVTQAAGVPGGPGLLQALFDLTPSEAMIARRLSAGQAADQIAQATGKSVLTIRTQVKAVLAKTGTRRQSELVHLLARLVPPAL